MAAGNALDNLAGTLEQELEREQMHLLLMQEKLDQQGTFIMGRLEELAKVVQADRSDRLSAQKAAREAATQVSSIARDSPHASSSFDFSLPRLGTRSCR